MKTEVFAIEYNELHASNNAKYPKKEANVCMYLTLHQPIVSSNRNYDHQSWEEGMSTYQQYDACLWRTSCGIMILMHDSMVDTEAAKFQFEIVQLGICGNFLASNYYNKICVYLLQLSCCSRCELSE